MKAVLPGAGLLLCSLGGLACKGADPVTRPKDMGAARDLRPSGADGPIPDLRPPGDLLNADLKQDPDLTTVDLIPPPDLTRPPDLIPPTVTPPGCADDNSVTAAQVYSLVIGTCTGGACHVGPGVMGGGLNLGGTVAEFKASVINKLPTAALYPHVTPGDIDKSYLLYKLTGQQGTVAGGGGGVMPQGVFLSTAQICVFINWVKFGAK